MRSIPSGTHLFLDFDGVICDSLEECYRSSWLTLSGASIGPAVPSDPPFDEAYRAVFNDCRPFIRSGEDYIVVHAWAAQGKVPRSQRDFDRSLEERGPEAMAELKRRLYQVREALLVHHHKLWLSWNPLYEGFAQALAAQIDNVQVKILSTKKAEFIVEILAHHGVPWPRERTIYTGTRRKLELITEMVGAQPSILVDDQYDHLDFVHPSCRCFLALWGYIAPGAAQTAGAALSLTQALELTTGFPRVPHPNA